MKILLAVDGSAYSDAAIEEVLRRPWPLPSEIKVTAPKHRRSSAQRPGHCHPSTFSNSRNRFVRRQRTSSTAPF